MFNIFPENEKLKWHYLLNKKMESFVYIENQIKFSIITGTKLFNQL